MCTILIVDDDIDSREAFAERLREVGHSVLLATNGSHALDLLALSRDVGAPPCVALIDLRMPVMDGWEFLAALERDGSWRKLRLIVSSGSAISDGPAIAHAKVIWKKPVDPNKLERIQDQCLLHARAASDGMAAAARALHEVESDVRVAEAVAEATRGAKRRSTRPRVGNGSRRKPLLPRNRPSRAR